MIPTLARKLERPKVKAWSDAQNGYARGFLDRLPGVPAIRARVKEIVEAASVSYYSLIWRPGGCSP
jgi:hypothetical protein